MRLIVSLMVWLFTSSAPAAEAIYHPMCLEAFHESDWNLPFNMAECQKAAIDVPVESSGVLFRISGGEHETRWYEKPLKDSPFGEGWVAATIPAETESAVAVEYIANGGGTAQMSSVFVFQKLPDGFIEMLAYAPFGDRCNDGGAELVSSYALGDDKSIVVTNATPFRLINPLNRFNWRFASFRKGSLDGEPITLDAYTEKYGIPEVTNGWLPYDDLGNGANWCSGFIEWYYDAGESDWQPLNVYVNKESFSGVSEKLKIDACINDWFSEMIQNKSPVNDEGYFKFNFFDWNWALGQLKEQCEPGPGLAGWFDFERQ